MGTLHSMGLRTYISTTVAVALALCAVFVSPAARADDDLPRYQLKVGQELVYRTVDPPEESDDGAGGKTINKRVTEWIVDVVEQTDEGTWFVFREKISATYTRGGKDSKQEYESDGHFLLTADGKFVENSTIRPMCDPTLLFPTLPPDEASVKNGWQDSLALDDIHRKFHVSPEANADDGTLWRFIDEPNTAFDVIYQSKTVDDFTFDRASGLVRKVVSTTKYGWPKSLAEKPQVKTIELAEVRQLDTSDLAALAKQSRVYFAAVDDYEKLTEQGRHDHRHTAMKYIEAENGLKKATEDLTLPWLRTVVDARLKQHARDAHYAVQDAVQFAKLLDQPSADWQTTDLDGNSRGLSDYRGQVIVLDFWYRACGWCIRAMPQMKQLTDEFKGQAVAILGINSDEEIADARYVIDALKLNYPTLRNGKGDDRINTKYKIHGWPTLMVIDKKGIVRHVHYGYTPTMRSELGEKIRELLAEPAG